jgi:hypothetical protein
MAEETAEDFRKTFEAIHSKIEANNAKTRQIMADVGLLLQQLKEEVNALVADMERERIEEYKVGA